MKFEKIIIPPGWQDSFTKYPNGRTIFEALSYTITTVNEGIEEVNQKVNQGLLAIEQAENNIRGEITESFNTLKLQLEDEIDGLSSDLIADFALLQSEVLSLIAGKANAADVYTKQQVDAQLAEKAKAVDVYTKQQVDAQLAEKAKAVDVYTKQQVDAQLAETANNEYELIKKNALEGYMPKHKIKEGFSVETFDSIAGFTNFRPSEGTLTEDFINFKTGDSSVKLAVNVAGSNNSMDKAININFKNTNKVFKVWAYFHDDPIRINTIRLYFGSVSSFAKVYMGDIANTIPNLKQGWNLLVFDANAFTPSGGESWDNTMVKMRISVLASAGQTCAVSFSDMICDVKTKPKIIISFDDGSDGVYTKAFPYMASRGIKGVAYIIPGKIGTTGHMTLEQVKELYANKWDLSGHSYNHVDLTLITQAEAQTEIENANNWLLTNGFKRGAYHMSIPFGKYNTAVLQAINDAGILTARNSNDGMTLPEALDYHKIPSKVIKNTTPISVITGWVDRAILNGETVVLMFHNFKDVASSTYEYSTQNFKEFIDYIYGNSFEKYVDAISDWYNNL